MAAISVEALNSFLFPDTAVYLFTSQTAPKILGTAGITPFINHLASVRNVATSTQAQALSALIFLCRDVLEVDVGHLAGLNRIQKISRIPVVLTAQEVCNLLIGIITGNEISGSIFPASIVCRTGIPSVLKSCRQKTSMPE